tara:strand:+ start:34 stop:660 length:627 start_codon:yes stop_codon:yes gene_type:complete
MGMFDRQPTATGTRLNLGATGAPAYNGAAANPFAQARQPIGGAFGGGVASAFGMQQPVQQQVTPPNETEILIHLLNSGYPIERWLTGAGFQSFVQMLSVMMELAVVNFFRDAKFVIDDDTGSMILDPTSLSTEMQTLSSENVVSEFANVLAEAEKTKTEATALQTEIATYSQQSMMGSALDAALANEGFMEKMGSGIGSLGRGFIGMK